MPTSRPAAILAASAVLCAVAAAPSGAATTCRSGDLGYAYRDGQTSLSTDVAKLRATGGATCRSARRIARTTALAILFDGHIPKEPQGYGLVVDKPCGRCTPRWTAVARRGKRKVTFAVRGGA